MSEVVRCRCGGTELFDTEGNGVCLPCYNAVVEAKNIAVHELFEARARIATLEKELADERRDGRASQG